MQKLLRLRFIGPVAVALSLYGCSEQGAPAKAHAVPAATDSAPPVKETVPAVYAASKLVGQWNGPEGTYLLVAGANGKYAVTIRNLDGPRSFQANGVGDTIEFERDGKRHTIRRTDGAGTGMKWLSDKKDCLVIEPGEGYCRD